MKGSMAMLLSVVLIGAFCALSTTGMRTAPMGKRSLLSRDTCSPADLKRAALGIPVECLQTPSWQTNNWHSHGQTHPSTPGQEAFGHNLNSHAGKRKLKTLSDACTAADLKRAAMGMPVSCMTGGFGESVSTTGYQYPHTTHGHFSPGGEEFFHNRNQHSNGRKLMADEDHHHARHLLNKATALTASAGPNRKLIHSYGNTCTEADIKRFEMGFDVSCMHAHVTDLNFGGNYDDHREWEARWGRHHGLGLGFGRGLLNIRGLIMDENDAIGNRRKVLSVKACTPAELERAAKGFVMECMQGDRNWENRWRRWRWWPNASVRHRGSGFGK